LTQQHQRTRLATTMLASKFRPISRRIGNLSTTAEGTLLKGTTACHAPLTSKIAARFISTEQEQNFKQLGILDDQGLTVFDTLHDMQVNSCRVFKDNELFGTYDQEAKGFKFMTYDEYNQKVNQCRTLLKDLGKS
jgi:hypothetical protein